MYFNPKERKCVMIVLKIKHFSGNLIILFLLKMYNYWGWKLLTYRVKKSWLVPSNLFMISINWIDPTQHQWIGPLRFLWRLLVCSNNILFIQSKKKIIFWLKTMFETYIQTSKINYLSSSSNSEKPFKIC